MQLVVPRLREVVYLCSVYEATDCFRLRLSEQMGFEILFALDFYFRQLLCLLGNYLMTVEELFMLLL